MDTGNEVPLFTLHNDSSTGKSVLLGAFNSLLSYCLASISL